MGWNERMHWRIRHKEADCSSQQANVFIVCIVDITGRQVIYWLLVENILLTCVVFTIEILDSKSNGKLNRYTVDYYVWGTACLYKCWYSAMHLNYTEFICMADSSVW